MNCLSYLRDGKVKLPLTVTKDGFLLELGYYGVDGSDEENVDDSLITGSQAMQGLFHMDKVCASLKTSAVSLEISVASLVAEKDVILFVMLCIKKIKCVNHYCGSTSWSVLVKYSDPDYNVTERCINVSLDAVNVHLIKVGPKVQTISYNRLSDDVNITLTQI